MSDPYKFRKNSPTRAPAPQQKAIAFESTDSESDRPGAHEGREATGAPADAGGRHASKESDVSAELLPADLLKRKAVVYVRQSTQTQVQTNLESQRRQYDLVELARRHGFASVEVIDDDLGRSASGSVARPGFDRLVAWRCAPERSAPCCVWMRRDSRATDATGITCSSCVDWSARGSSIRTASTIRVGRTTGCCWA
jgi:hypothetical protein